MRNALQNIFGVLGVFVYSIAYYHLVTMGQELLCY